LFFSAGLCPAPAFFVGAAHTRFFVGAAHTRTRNFLKKVSCGSSKTFELFPLYLVAHVFRFPKGLFSKSPFGAVWSAQLHEKHGVFLFAVGGDVLDAPLFCASRTKRKSGCRFDCF
jgi:hypothetical protein